MVRLIVLYLLIGALAKPAHATTDPAEICDAVAGIAAREAGLSVSMLRALTRTETGRARNGRLTPWPWTVNMEGAGRWFDTRNEALAYARKHHARGATSFDVGCFQINYRWHHKAFTSVEAMFDPLENARYAAKFLLELKSEGVDWQKAVGHYHSRTPTLAQKYVTRFNRIREKLRPPASEAVQYAKASPSETPSPAPRKSSSSPLLIAASVDRRGAAPPNPGGVSLALFTQSSGKSSGNSNGQTKELLTPARPLFD